jgi:serine/threonine protein kinase/tetratricopeptide (TPR) repeat protein
VRGQEGQREYHLERLAESLGGDYRIGHVLGSGGMSVVYLAEDLKHHRQVAVKVLRPELTAMTVVDRFLREIEIIAKLDHPNILPLFDSGEFNGTPYYIMPVVAGETLREHLDTRGPLSIDDAVRIVTDVADALGHAHALGIVHRDIKPENILLSGGRAIVVDFGIARAVSQAVGDRITSSGIVIGTPEYMSPEQTSDATTIDGRSDLYSLGCVLYEMLGGDPPFAGRTAQAIMARQVAEVPHSLELVRPNIPPHILAAVEKLLQKYAADRYATAYEFRSALLDKTLRPQSQKPSGRRVVWAVATFAPILALGLFAVLTSLGPELDDNRVIIFPIAGTNDSLNEAGIGWNVALAIGAALEHAQPLKGIDGWSLVPETIRIDPRKLTTRLTRRISTDQRARYYMDGTVRQTADSVSLLLRLNDVDGDSVVARETINAGLNVAAEFLGMTALTRLLPTLIDPARPVDLSPFTDRSANAIALTIQAERAYRQSNFDAAFDLYTRAVDEDSLMAFAAVKGAQAAAWTEQLSNAYRLIDVALRHDSLLPPKYSEFAHGWQAFLEGRSDEAAVRLTAALDLDSTWTEAWMALGDVFYHTLPANYDRLDSLAEAAFLAAAEDTTFSPPVIHLAEIAARRSDIEAIDHHISILRRMRSDPTLQRQLTLLRGCVRGELSASDWHRQASVDLDAVAMAAKALSGHAAQSECARLAFRAVFEHENAEYRERWAALLGLQSLAMAHGRYEEARELLDTALEQGLRAAHMLYVFDDMVGAPFASRAVEAERVAREGAGELYERGQGDTQWLLGAWLAKRGDLERASEVATALGNRADSSGSEHDRFLTGLLTAHVAVASGERDRALELLRRMTAIAPAAGLTWDLVRPMPLETAMLAELLLEGGEYDAAMRTAERFDHPAPIMYLPLLPQSLRIRVAAARALDRLQLADSLNQRLSQLGWSMN